MFDSNFDPADHWSINPRDLTTRLDEFEQAEYDSLVEAYERSQRKTAPAVSRAEAVF